MRDKRTPPTSYVASMFASSSDDGEYFDNKEGDDDGSSSFGHSPLKKKHAPPRKSSYSDSDLDSDSIVGSPSRRMSPGQEKQPQRKKRHSPLKNKHAPPKKSSYSEDTDSPVEFEL